MALDVKHKYPTLVSLIQHSETVRWTRLNNFLLLESVLAAAWGAVATSDVLKGSSLFLTILCGLGCLFAVLWVGLAVRSSEFLRLYQELGRKEI